ncbi:MAG: diguanylate cyclase [Bacillota bacterium]
MEHAGFSRPLAIWVDDDQGKMEFFKEVLAQGVCFPGQCLVVSCHPEEVKAYLSANNQAPLVIPWPGPPSGDRAVKDFIRERCQGSCPGEVFHAFFDMDVALERYGPGGAFDWKTQVDGAMSEGARVWCIYDARKASEFAPGPSSWPGASALRWGGDPSLNPPLVALLGIPGLLTRAVTLLGGDAGGVYHTQRDQLRLVAAHGLHPSEIAGFTVGLPGESDCGFWDTASTTWQGVGGGAIWVGARRSSLEPGAHNLLEYAGEGIVHHWKSDPLGGFHRAVRSIVALRPEEEIPSLVAEALAGVMGADAAELYLIGGEGSLITGAYPADLKWSGSCFVDASGLMPSCYVLGLPFIAGDTKEAPPRAPALNGLSSPGYRSCMAVAVRHEGRPVGAIHCHSKRVNHWGPEDLGVAEALADIVSMVLENSRLHARVKKEFEASMRLLGTTIDTRDQWLAAHSSVVAGYAVAIAQEMNLDAEDVRRLEMAALLHDIGKVGIPDTILKKPGRLKPEEQAMLMSHAETGAAILEESGSPFNDVSDLVLHHHEWYNGHGYPAGITKPSRLVSILALANALAAMTSPRRHRRTLSSQEALREVHLASGTQFDPEAVAALLRLAERGEIPRVDTGEKDGMEKPQAVAVRAVLRAREMGALMSVAEIRTRLNEPDEIVDAIMDTFHRTLGYQHCYLYLLTPYGAVVRSARGSLSPPVGLMVDRSVLRPILEPGGITLGPGHTEGARSCASCVLKGAGGDLGVLCLASEDDNGFNEADVSLLRTVSGHVASAIETAQLVIKLEMAADTDFLTGAHNRRYLSKRLSKEISRARRHGGHVTLVFMDIDDLKGINDTHGHVSGDRVLQAMAATVRSVIRDEDIFARFGGDEFVLVLPDTDPQGAAELIERIRAAISATVVDTPGARLPLPTFSSGTSAYPTEVSTAEELIQAADAWMYRKRLMSRRRVKNG